MLATTSGGVRDQAVTVATCGQSSETNPIEDAAALKRLANGASRRL